MSRNEMPFDIDIGELNTLGQALGGTKEQIQKAYKRALGRAMQAARRNTAKMMREQIGVRDRKQAEGRVKDYIRGDGAKLWIGLNRFRVSELQGRIYGNVGAHHDLRDPKTGRYTEAENDDHNVRFRPRGAALKQANAGGINFKNAFIGDARYGKQKGRQTIFVRPGRGQSREAEVDVYSVLIDKIESEVFEGLSAKFLHEFEVDLRGRVAAGIHNQRKHSKGK